MLTVTGGTAAHRCRKFALGCLFAVGTAIWGQAHAEAGATPGGAVPKDDPWKLTRVAALSIDIPKASERPLSAEDGPRVRVESFDLDIESSLGSVLGPELAAQMRSLVESRRMAAPPDGFTIGQMEQVAAAVTEFLRSNDFIVAYAYIPTQQVDASRVKIAVLSGTLGEVIVEGNNMLSSKRIALPFNALLGKPLQKKNLERAILRVRDYPGVAPQAILSPGDEVGTTNLTLRVLERRANIAFMADNYGSEETGEGRGRIRFDWNNPLGLGDLLTFNVLQTFSPADGTFGGVSYEIPFGASGFSIGALYDENTFDFTSGQLKLGGDSDTAAVFARQRLVRSRELNIDLRVDLAVKTASFDTFGLEDPEDALSVASVSLDLEGVDRIGALGVNSLSLGYHHGIADFLGSMDDDGIGEDGEISTRSGSSGERAGGEFDKFTLRYQRLQRINDANTFIFRAFGQWTDDLLTSLEQMTMGGPYNVRAYPTAEFLVDKGAFGSLEYTLNATSLFETIPDSWDLNFSLFYDYAYGKTLQALTSERPTVKLGGVGIGIHYEVRWGRGNGLMIRVEVAAPTTSIDASNDRDPQYWLRLEFFRR